MPTAYFLLNVAINHETEIIEKIKEVLEKEKSIDFEIRGVYGIYEIVLKITAKSDDELRHILLEKIKPIPRIQSAITMMTTD